MAGISDPSGILKHLAPGDRALFHALNNIAESLDDSQTIPPQLATAIAHLGNLNATLTALNSAIVTLTTIQSQLATAVQALSTEISAMHTWNAT